MKPITLFAVVLLAVAGFGAGIWVGRHGARANAASPEAAINAETASAPGKLVAAKEKARTATTTADKSGPHLSLAEIETALTELKSLSRARRWERVNEIAKAVDPADIPQVLALAT
ncbi:MAG: hypothetical protein KBH45_09575, partial [Verrucomicrobia bacterium]|nr:hypothetical protein [Verrucomicrobiota bacterium]